MQLTRWGLGVRGWQRVAATRLLSLSLCLCASVMGCLSVQAQSFGPTVPTDLLLALLDRQGNQKFTLGLFYAGWENPFRVKLQTFSPALLQNVSKEVRFIGRTSASPLIEATYHISPRWGVGLWYNPIHDKTNEQLVRIADVEKLVQLSRDADLLDLHVIYYGPRGLSGQLGYYHEKGTYHSRTADPVPDPEYQRLSQDYTQASWNLWVNQRLDAKWKGRLVMPYLSIGYHPASDLNSAVSILTGVGLTFNERISLSGSIWFFDLSQTATRVTAGLVVRI